MFKDRFDAGKQLARKLQKYKGSKSAIILAIPRGGLQIGYELAKGLDLTLDIIVVKKIPYPGDPEYAIGAVGVNEVIIDDAIVKRDNISKSHIDTEVKNLNRAIKEKYAKYRGKKPLPNLKSKVVILTDDGLATGHTMMAAAKIVRKQNPAKIVLAVPVAPPATLDKFESAVDEVVCIERPFDFHAIGQFYEEFVQVEDEEAINYLKEANK